MSGKLVAKRPCYLQITTASECLVIMKPMSEPTLVSPTLASRSWVLASYSGVEIKARGARNIRVSEKRS